MARKLQVTGGTLGGGVPLGTSGISSPGWDPGKDMGVSGNITWHSISTLTALRDLVTNRALCLLGGSGLGRKGQQAGCSGWTPREGRLTSPLLQPHGSRVPGGPCAGSAGRGWSRACQGGCQWTLHRVTVASAAVRALDDRCGRRACGRSSCRRPVWLSGWDFESAHTSRPLRSVRACARAAVGLAATAAFQCPGPASRWTVCTVPWYWRLRLLWLSGWSSSLRTKGSLVRFPIRAHAWVAGQVPSRGAREKQPHIGVFLPLFLLPFPSL